MVPGYAAPEWARFLKGRPTSRPPNGGVTWGARSACELKSSQSMFCMIYPRDEEFDRTWYFRGCDPHLFAGLREPREPGRRKASVDEASCERRS